jgi:hypothetical protein
MKLLLKGCVLMLSMIATTAEFRNGNETYGGDRMLEAPKSMKGGKKAFLAPKSEMMGKKGGKKSGKKEGKKEGKKGGKGKDDNHAKYREFIIQLL